MLALFVTLALTSYLCTNMSILLAGGHTGGGMLGQPAAAAVRLLILVPWYALWVV